ncbi:hypothetical protein THICB2_810013 [Thiomonas sp. CB2]|nr:hypothetical protein THICB2_810013 [Thiomonas sp. CB2]VDY06677.1 protein of unknown function [Thiomonas sp. Bio17B3]VDY10029.1 protein of unknown function [Thiomonas sp. Sup16B3]VDY14951.1 conserved protein of unknown function [Thiomonas sp. OC7]VDY15872.1 protein of unknown function [Thiomonas sp. CB2]
MRACVGPCRCARNPRDWIADQIGRLDQNMGRVNTAAAVKRFTPSVPTPQSQGRAPTSGAATLEHSWQPPENSMSSALAGKTISCARSHSAALPKV